MICKAKKSLLPDNQMIMGSNAHQLARVNQSLCDIFIFGAGRGIATGVIVHEHDPGG